MTVLRDTRGRFAPKPTTADEAVTRRFNAGISQCRTHMRNHPPSQSRTRRVSELLMLSVEDQLRLLPGGRQFLPLPRSWEPRGVES